MFRSLRVFSWGRVLISGAVPAMLVWSAVPASGGPETAARRHPRPYPETVRRKVAGVLARDLVVRLEDGVDRYLEQRRHASVTAAAARAGLSTADARVLAERFPRPVELPGVHFTAGVALIREGADEIRVGPEEMREGAIRVNGKRFRWERGLDANENLRRYDALFAQPSASWSVIRSAHAETGQTFAFRAAGLTLYFNIARPDGKLFENLMREADRTLEACTSGEDDDQAGDPLLPVVMSQAAPVAENLQRDLRSCKELEEYAHSLQLTLPPQLCHTLDDLADCLKISNGQEASVSDSAQKNLREWAPGNIRNAPNLKQNPTAPADSTRSVR